ncbi:MAG: response regulator, partial [Candidatus Delongbacteria bacterium]|nr:response regulator [Candidatus Delongbacteria bacterium]
KLFIADNDDNLINSISRNIISKFGDTVEYSLCPEAASEKVMISKPDIVITDINFSSSENDTDPGMITAGVEFARKVRKHLPETRIIAISGYRNNDEIFEKITEKDWYDVFHTKGGDDLYDKYEQLRTQVINRRTGLIPFLSKFFSPLNHNWDDKKSIYRLLHTNYERQENLRCIPGILEYFDSFKDMLQSENSKIITDFINNYKEREVSCEEREELKRRFHLKTNEMECLYGSIRTTVYAERDVVEEIWNKMVSETRDHSDFHGSVFSTDLKDCEVIFSIRQNSRFDFDRFLESGRTLTVYKKIQFYGDLIISSGHLSMSSVKGSLSKNEHPVEGTVIKMRLKI